MRHKLTHKGEGKKHKCEQCEKYFALARTQKAHKLIHYGEKHYTCEQCKKSFIYAHNLYIWTHW